MSDFWSLYFRFNTPQGIALRTFLIELQNPATSPKDHTLKLKGLVTLQQIDALTQWSFLVGKGSALACKVAGLTPNGVVEGCFPTSMTFNVVHFPDRFILEQSEGYWWQTHMVMHYDHINSRAEDIAAFKKVLEVPNESLES